MATPLKDRFDRETVDLLTNRFSRFHEEFDAAAFSGALLAAFPRLELKDRINLVADRLHDDLTDDYPSALSIVLEVADSGIDGWSAWPLCSFVERHGVEQPVISLEAMPELTKHWSCEFAIRPFLENHLDLTRSYLRRWVLDPHEAVRRLPSEGTRPLLPWGPRVKALTADPQIGLELLSALRHDPSETVRRSVANHLNDVSKSHPDLVVEVLSAWSDEANPIDHRMIGHALRTLVKQGHAGALALLGYTTNPEVKVVSFTCTPSPIDLGNHIELVAELTSSSEDDQRLVIDFVVHHVNASGATSPKVFKWTTLNLAPDETVRITKRRMIQTASTRRYHAEVHRIDLKVAGKELALTQFHLDEGSHREASDNR